MPLTSIYLLETQDCPISIRELSREDINILIVGNQAAAESRKTLYVRFIGKCSGKFPCFPAVAAGALPAFIICCFIK
jgi:hypothetical protein